MSENDLLCVNKKKLCVSTGKKQKIKRNCNKSERKYQLTDRSCNFSLLIANYGRFSIKWAIRVSWGYMMYFVSYIVLLA